MAGCVSMQRLSAHAAYPSHPFGPGLDATPSGDRPIPINVKPKVPLESGLDVSQSSGDQPASTDLELLTKWKGKNKAQETKLKVALESGSDVTQSSEKGLATLERLVDYLIERGVKALVFGFEKTVISGGSLDTKDFNEFTKLAESKNLLMWTLAHEDSHNVLDRHTIEENVRK